MKNLKNTLKLRQAIRNEVVEIYRPGLEYGISLTSRARRYYDAGSYAKYIDYIESCRGEYSDETVDLIKAKYENMESNWDSCQLSGEDIIAAEITTLEEMETLGEEDFGCCDCAAQITYELEEKESHCGW